MEVSLELTSGSNLRGSVGNRVGGEPRTRRIYDALFEHPTFPQINIK
jgi:hypothetical protein